MQYHKIKKKLTYKRKKKVTARQVGSMPRAKPSRKKRAATSHLASGALSGIIKDTTVLGIPNLTVLWHLEHKASLLGQFRSACSFSQQMSHGPGISKIIIPMPVSHLSLSLEITGFTLLHSPYFFNWMMVSQSIVLFLWRENMTKVTLIKDSI